MVAFHLVYDLNEYLNVDVNYLSGFWYWIGKSSALIFIFASGISSGFSRKILRRGLLVLGLGLIISATSYVVLGDMYIRFGILHFLGACMLLYPLMARPRAWILAIIAVAIVSISRLIGSITVKTGLLLPLGIKYPGFSSVDYFPFIPYLAVFLLGIIAFKLYYHRGQSLFPFTWENSVVTALSRNSLMIYILHQPLIMGVIMLYKYLV